ncbi:MAG: sigma factor-like helix-turn-helix DNA-binding protein, partial [Chloroflexota bacterium]
ALNMLRSRATRREAPLDVHLPDLIVDPAEGTDPEHEAMLAGSVGLALLVVLETLSPPERLAFVLHDMFAVPFDQIARIIERSPEAARQLASRARRRVRGAAPPPDADLNAQWEAVEAFLAATRDGNLAALIAVLDPEILLRVDGGMAMPSQEVRGAATVAGQAMLWSRVAQSYRRALINGAAGVVAFRSGEPFAVGTFAVRGGKMIELNILADPERLKQLDLPPVQDQLSTAE